MRGILFGTWLAGSVLCLAACTASPQERTAATCTTICRCVASPLPGAQDQCTDQCEAGLGTVSEDCSACVAEHADRCASLENECENRCGNSPPPPTGGGGDSGPDAGIKIVDAFAANKEGQ